VLTPLGLDKLEYVADCAFFKAWYSETTTIRLLLNIYFYINGMLLERIPLYLYE